MFAATIGTASVRSERRIGPSRRLFFGDATLFAYSFDYSIATEGKRRQLAPQDGLDARDLHGSPRGRVGFDGATRDFCARFAGTVQHHRVTIEEATHDRSPDPHPDPHRLRT